VDSSSLDMAVYITRFIARNYKNPEDISFIVAACEDRVKTLMDRLTLTRDMALELLISYPRYFSSLCDLPSKMDEIMGVLECLGYAEEDMIRLVFK
jgi:hypothetical protein